MRSSLASLDFVIESLGQDTRSEQPVSHSLLRIPPSTGRPSRIMRSLAPLPVDDAAIQ
jgi:hypothetical protein